MTGVTKLKDYFGPKHYWDVYNLAKEGKSPEEISEIIGLKLDAVIRYIDMHRRRRENSKRALRQKTRRTRNQIKKGYDEGKTIMEMADELDLWYGTVLYHLGRMLSLEELESYKEYCQSKFREAIKSGDFIPFFATKEGREWARMRAINDNPMFDPKIRKKQGKSVSKTIKRMWKDPDYVEKTVKSWQRKPTKPEVDLFNLCYINRFPVKYVGDWSFPIFLPKKLARKYGKKFVNPDFIVEPIEETKKIILLNGDYYHTDEEAEMDMKLYHELGYDCLIIWESELEDELLYVLARLRDFVKVE